MSYAYDYDTSDETAPRIPRPAPFALDQFIDDPSLPTLQAADARQRHLFHRDYFYMLPPTPWEPFATASSITAVPAARHEQLIGVRKIVADRQLSSPYEYPYQIFAEIYPEGNDGTHPATIILTTMGSQPANTSITPIRSEHDVLAGYERYSVANWDGYDAEPIALETIAATRTFLSLLPQTFGDPDIAPGSDGTIGLEWRLTDRPLRKLFIDIGPGKVWKGFWRKASSEHKVLPEKLITNDTVHELASLFRELEV